MPGTPPRDGLSVGTPGTVLPALALLALVPARALWAVAVGLKGPAQRQPSVGETAAGRDRVGGRRSSVRPVPLVGFRSSTARSGGARQPLLAWSSRLGTPPQGTVVG